MPDEIPKKEIPETEPKPYRVEDFYQLGCHQT